VSSLALGSPAPSRSREVRKRLVAVGAGFLVLMAAVVVGLRTTRQSQLYLHPPRLPVTAADRGRVARFLPALRDVELHTRDGLRLSGWFAPGHARTAVILVHGYSSNRMQLLPEAVLFSRHGHGVLLFDERASGESEGTVSTWGDRETLDVLAAVDLVSRQPEVDAIRVGLYGFSIGSNAVAAAAATDARVHAAAMGPVWPSLEEELASKFPVWHGRSLTLAKWLFHREGADVEAVHVADRVRAIAPRPVLLISGAEDPDTPPEMTRRVATQAPSAETWLVPRARHGGYADTAAGEFDRRVAGFFDHALLGATPGR
jgi:uncharacterized protein